MSRYQWPNSGKSEDRPLERMRHNRLTDGVLLAEAVTAAREHRVEAEALGARPRAAPAGDANLWVPIGPSTVLRGQAGSRPRVAGRVRDLAVSDDGRRVYAATANGGIWYSADAGGSWSPLGNWLPTPGAGQMTLETQALTCGCLLVRFGAAADGSADDVYVGTGELRPEAFKGTPADKLGGVGVLHLDKPLPEVLANPFENHWKREAKNLAGHGIYRLARDPNDANRLVAATSVGLFTRSGPFVEDAEWTPVAPFNFTVDDWNWTTDVVWAKSAPARLWVALQAGADTGVWYSTNGAAGPFEKVEGMSENIVKDGRLGLAIDPSDPSVVYVLGKGPRLWRISGSTATKVNDLPPRLFGKSDDEEFSYYDLAIAVAIAVHPDKAFPGNKDVVIIGGSAVEADGESSASLFKCTITNTDGNLRAGFVAANQPLEKHAQDPTFIGNGVHADVHQISIRKIGGELHVWIGCDGGVFHSSQNGVQNSFIAQNTGLAVLETGYVASHPDNDAFVIAGTQDNGALLRVGDTVWMHSVDVGGDSGGVMFHPTRTHYFAAQYTNSEWYSNGRLSQPVVRRTGGDSEGSENKKASFYSGGDIHKVGATNQARLAIGTNRIWLADDWDPTTSPTVWRTLPSFTDPRGGVGRDTATDTYGEATGQVIACRWMDDNRLVALMQSKNREGKDSAVLMFTRQPDGKWERKEISHHANKCFDYSNGDISQPTSGYLPPLGPWSDLAIHKPSTGANGSFYVACTGHVRFDGNTPIPSDRMDTLWWYDGTSKWYPTGLRNQGTKAPAYAVICDPANDANTVYVGTALGVWQGVLSFAGTTPSWIWSDFYNGLPEAPVQDLSLYNRGTIKLLRAAIQARGIWEMDLSAVPGPIRRTFLRVHANDARRAATTSLANPGKVGPSNWPWHASPDVRIRPAPLSAAGSIRYPKIKEPKIPTAASPWNGKAPDQYLLWIFQAAFRKVDPLCRPNGVWTEQFAARLIAHRAIDGDPGTSGNTIDGITWGKVVTAANVFSAPWGDGQPTEADLFELVIENPTTAGAGPEAGPPKISFVMDRKYKVDVLVHYRDLRPLAAGEVRVSLLRRQLPAAEAQWPAIAISAAWKTRVEQLMSGAPPAGWSLPDSWTAADVGSRTRSLLADIDARTPRAVTFDVDFSGQSKGRHFVLLAVIHSTPDPVSTDSLAGGNLRDLILNCHHVAARVVEVRR